MQVLEPALALFDAPALRESFQAAYAALDGVLPLNLVTFYDDLGDAYPWAVQLPVAAVSLDFCGVVRLCCVCTLQGPRPALTRSTPQIGAATPCRTLELLQQHGFPAGKRLGAGVIDGRNVWADTGAAAALVQAIKAAGVERLAVQPSCSLQHVPVDVALETKLELTVKSRLAFAVQKLAELASVARDATAAKAEAAPAAPTRAEVPRIDPRMFDRSQPFEQRRDAQHRANPQVKGWGWGPEGLGVQGLRLPLRGEQRGEERAHCRGQGRHPLNPRR